MGVIFNQNGFQLKSHQDGNALPLKTTPTQLTEHGEVEAGAYRRPSLLHASVSGTGSLHPTKGWIGPQSF